VHAVDAPFVDLLAEDGARARVHLDGAQVVSWIPAGGDDDRLFVSANAHYGVGRSIRGGIPLCFPQFGATGPLRQHGFARLQRWTVLRDMQGSDGARVVLQLVDSDDTRTEWPFQFSIELSVHVASASLAVELTVTNTDGQPFEFTAALHPYFRVRDAYVTAVRGLGGTRYRDALRDGAAFEEVRDVLPVDGPLDRVYADTAAVLEIVEPHRTLRLEKRGFPDAVVWNPGPDGVASRADFMSGDERHMLCVEAGAILSPVSLAPGAQWTGTQVMTAVGSTSPPV
jgi:glucose-6-phosphate 1-epimerase